MKYNNYEEYSFSLGNADFVFISDAGSFLMGTSAASSLHSHKFCELFYILEGEMELSSGTEYRFSKGDCVIIPHDIMHSSVVSDTSRRIALSFTVTKNFSGEKDFFHIFEQFTKEKITVLKNFAGGDAFRRITAYCCSNYSDKNALVSACLQEIMLLARASANREASTTNGVAAESDSYRHYVIERYFDTRYKSGRLSELAELLHLSNQQTSRIIQKLYRKSFCKKMTEKKMQVARLLLIETPLCVNSIAAETGYKSAGSFFDTFKAYYGTTPLKFRKESSNLRRR